MRLRGLLESAQEVTDLLAEDAPVSEEERTILAQVAAATAKHKPRTRKDVLRFGEAIRGGEEGWLILRSVPGEHAVEAVFMTKLSAACRKTLGI
jgi:hypothetical protein